MRPPGIRTASWPDAHLSLPHQSSLDPFVKATLSHGKTALGCAGQHLMLLVPECPCVCCHDATPLLHPLKDHMADQGNSSWNHDGIDHPRTLEPTVPCALFFMYMMHTFYP